MIEEKYQEQFTELWINTNIKNPENELVILRKIIPWDKICRKLVKFYHPTKGKNGKSLRMMISLIILQKLRHLGDKKVVEYVRENRYMQYFCNVPDKNIFTFVDSSTISDFRKRIGVEGAEIIENEIFNKIRKSGIIEHDTLLMDSTVLNSNIIHPNDVQLIYKGIKKMRIVAKNNKIPVWWDDKKLKKRWRAFGLDKTTPMLEYLKEFQDIFREALEEFQKKFSTEQEVKELIQVLLILLEQTNLKLTGEKHIKGRIVSLDDIESRPIKKGKKYPSCEFGYKTQMTFNRQGFMITTENFIGNPDDKSLFPETIEIFKKKDEKKSRKYCYG